MTDKKLKGSGMRSRNRTSPTRQGVAAKELQEARRRRRHREVMRNRIILGACLVLVLALIIFLISRLIGGLFSGSGADTSTITFLDNGQIVFEEVTDFDTDTYSKSELKTYTEDLIDSFNETYEDEAISLDKLSVKGDTSYIKTTYKDADCYESFTSYTTFLGTYDEAKEAGFDFAELFSAVSDSQLSEAEIVDTDTLFEGFNVAIVSENVSVVVPGDIVYVSNANIELLDTDSLAISQADGNEDATDLVYILYTN